MEIVAKIEVDIKTKGKLFVVGSLPELQMLMGATSVSGNLSLYGVKKVGNKYVVPIEKVRERLATLEERLNRMGKVIGRIQQILHQRNRKT